MTFNLFIELRDKKKKFSFKNYLKIYYRVMDSYHKSILNVHLHFIL